MDDAAAVGLFLDAADDSVLRRYSETRRRHPLSGDDLRGGLRALEDWLWPYRGGREWARLAVLLPVPVALAGAAALCFWPWRH